MKLNDYRHCSEEKKEPVEHSTSVCGQRHLQLRSSQSASNIRRWPFLFLVNLRWLLILKFERRHVDYTYREGNCIAAVWVYFQVLIRSVYRHTDSCLYHSSAMRCSLMLSPSGKYIIAHSLIFRYYFILSHFVSTIYLTLTPTLIVLLDADVCDVDIYPFIIDSDHLNGEQNGRKKQILNK